MNDDEKTKEQLIAELNELRGKSLESHCAGDGVNIRQTLGGSETILVVDDNEEARRATTVMLKDFGYTLLEAESSSEAVDIFTTLKQEIHLVLTDIVMPEMNGLEMAKQMLAVNPNADILFMSAYAGDDIINDDVFNIIKSGAQFISKPFTIKEIGQKIRKLLDPL